MSPRSVTLKPAYMLGSLGRLFSLMITMGAELQWLFVSPSFTGFVESCLVSFFFPPSKQGQKSRMNFLTEVAEFGAFGEKNVILARKEKFCNYQESH